MSRLFEEKHVESIEGQTVQEPVQEEENITSFASWVEVRAWLLQILHS